MSVPTEKKHSNQSPTRNLVKKLKVEAVEHVEMVLNLKTNFHSL